MNDITEEIQQWLLDNFESRATCLEPEEKQIEMVDEFIQEELNMGTNLSLVNYVEMDFTAEVILEMLTYVNAYLKDNFGDESGVKIFTVQNIFDTFALVVAYEYREAIRCCTFDELERELNTKRYQVRTADDNFCFDSNGNFDFETLEKAMQVFEESKQNHNYLRVTQTPLIDRSEMIAPTIIQEWTCEPNNVKCFHCDKIYCKSHSYCVLGDDDMPYCCRECFLQC